MRADPEPEIAAIHVHGERAIAQADPHGPVTPNLLELQRWMARIAFQKCIIGVSQPSNRKRQRVVGGPRISVTPNASQVARAPGAMGGESFVRERIKLAG